MAKAQTQAKELMSPEEQKLSDDAIAWARANKKAFAKAQTDQKKYPGESSPVSVFMAGSPGAGKTEVSKALASQLDSEFLRIDPDEYRTAIPGYNGTNSWLFQGAVSILVGRVLDCAIDQQQSFLLDGTLSNFDQAVKNVERSLSKGRTVLIVYVYQEPDQAWKFVQAREVAEGRRIPADRFVKQFFGAHDVVNRLKVKYGSSVRIDVIFKDINGGNKKYLANVSDLAQNAPIKHSIADVEAMVGLP